MKEGQNPSLAFLKTELEDLWSKFDQAYAPLKAEDWAKKYGKDWTFADQPYHMAYFDGVMVATPIAKGDRLLESERWLLHSVGEINKWNADEFAKRLGGQTAQKSLEEWKAKRDVLRKSMANMKDADLGKRVWIPLMMGWSTVGDALMMALVHGAGEYAELRMRLKGKAPELSANAAHARLGFMLFIMGVGVNKELAKEPFTAVWNFTGNGGGTWTLAAANGACKVTEGPAQKADVTMTTDFYTFERLGRKMGSPMMLMLTGKMKVKGMSKMGTFKKLFPEPKPDTQLVGKEGMAAG